MTFGERLRDGDRDATILRLRAALAWSPAT